MSTSTSKNIQLGFAEDQDSWLLTNRFFPSKIGNQPAWLELQNIPEVKDVACDYCGELCIFLCQIYAGSEHIAHAFHRTIFVFICTSGKCCLLNQAGNIKVLRSQLPLKNAFYPDTPADDTVECDAVEAAVKLCRVCGCRGPLVCGKCKKVGYCGQLHQKLDWKIHKQHCGVSAELKAPPNEILFPEFEIVIEQEEQQVENGKQETEKEAEKRRLREYEDIAKSCQAGGLAEMSEADLNDLAESKEDKAFGRFKKAIESYESQVLRYNRHGSPLWISDHGILKPSSVPTCANCKGRRTFEFQLMPQMLNELKNYDLDWGVIAVYTCEKDCDVGGKYVPEFCYKQDVMKSDDEAKIDLGSLKLEAENAREESGSEAAVCDDGNSAEVPKKNVVKASKKAKQLKATKMFKENDEWE